MSMFSRIAWVPFVVLMAVSLIAGCGGGGAAPAKPEAKSDAKPTEAAKPVEAAKPAEPAAPAPAPAEAKAPESATPASTPAAPAGPALDATTIVGTKWSAAGYVLAFQENGVVKINDDTEGTWKIDGNKLSIEAGGTTYEATLEGDKIMYEGAPLEKL